MNFDEEKSLKRCSSAPIINNIQSIHKVTPTLPIPMNTTQNNTGKTTPSASRSRYEHEIFENHQYDYNI